MSLVKTVLDRATKLQDELTSAGESSADLRHSQVDAPVETTDALCTIGDTQGALAAAQKSLAIARNLAKDKDLRQGQDQGPARSGAQPR